MTNSNLRSLEKYFKAQGTTSQTTETVTPTTDTAGITLVGTNVATANGLDLGLSALSSGTAIDVSDLTAITTGNALRIEGADALTTGDLVSLESDSADTSARALIKMHNNNAAAVGCVPLEIVNDALVDTNFKIVADVAGCTLFVSDGTSPNTALNGTQGDVCFGADSGKSYYCATTGTTWTAF